MPPNPHPKSYDTRMYTDSLSSRSQPTSKIQHPKSDIRNPTSTDIHPVIP
jgi:hypothetical protein